ncbi:hypothetical protein B0J14DRAFT_606087 [Halenospora varia]|nr:hypothetical protein B0J14DRAFT_606087 [Halenospora varia]
MIPTNKTSFSIIVPSDLGDINATAGACVLQRYWNVGSINQMYEPCIDFLLVARDLNQALPARVLWWLARQPLPTPLPPSLKLRQRWVSTSAPAVSYTAAAVATSPISASTTLQTIVKSSSVASVSISSSTSSAPAATESAGNNDDDCEL